MTEQQRVVVAITLCLVIFLGWQWLAMKFSPPPEELPELQVVAAPRLPAPEQPAAVVPVPAPEPAELVLRPADTDMLSALVRTSDLAFTKLSLRAFEEPHGEGTRPVSLVFDGAAPWQGRLELAVDGAGIGNYTSETGLTFSRSTEVVDATVTIVPTRGQYYFDYDVTLHNKSQDSHQLTGRITLGAVVPETAPSSFFAPQMQTLHALCASSAGLERETAQDLAEEPVTGTVPAQWLGIDRQYFLTAVLPRSEGFGACQLTADKTGLYAGLPLTTVTLEPGQSVTRKLRFFAGPKRDFEMAQAAPALLDAVDYDLWGMPLGFLARPMVAVMNAFHSWTTSWGVAIMMLTLLVKLLLFPVSLKHSISMRRMQLLNPELTRIKEQFGKDREKQQQEMMKLYRDQGINPLAGCLPMLLQMPVWMALYRTLWSAVDLYREPFLWISDLTAKEPFPYMAVVLGALMIVQQKMTPTTMDSQQAKIMMYVMPLMMTVFMIALPSGLVLYILVNSILTIAQQLVINRHLKSAPATSSAKPQVLAVNKRA